MDELRRQYESLVVSLETTDATAFDVASKRIQAGVFQYDFEARDGGEPKERQE